MLSFDYRGHGHSSSTQPYTFEQIVDDVEQIRRHFSGDEKAIICGGSFGGFLALHYAIKYADKVQYLILRGAAPSYHRESPWSTRHSLLTHASRGRRRHRGAREEAAQGAELLGGNAQEQGLWRF